MSYRNYLRGRNLSVNTAVAYERFIVKFEQWLEEENIRLGEVGHAEIMAYTTYLRSKNLKPSSINGKLRALRYYFLWHGIRPNPCWQIKVRGGVRRIPIGLLTELEILALYESHPEQFAREICRKVYLGLMSFQGLNSSEIRNLEITQMNVEVGYIRIIGTNKINTRTLKIDEAQRDTLIKYINQSRTELLPKESYNPYLIANTGEVQNTKSVTAETNSWLHKKQIKNPKVIRASVISNWIKRHNLREAQYMAGHKYVSSTERYRQDNLEDLQRALDESHPLGNLLRG